MKNLFISMLICACICLGQAVLAEKYSADMVIKAKGQTITGKYYISGNKYRIDNTIGGMSTSTIILPDKNIMYTLMHNQKMYMQLPVQKAGASFSNTSPGSYRNTMKFLKNETINGIAAKKFKAVNHENNGVVYIWMTKDGKWPVRVDVPAADTFTEYKNINTNFPESVFDVPAGYKTFGIPNLGNFLN